jgi:hypothetical protein
VRRQPLHNQSISSINPPKGLPKDCYNSDWLEEQDEKVANALEIPAAPPAALPPILKRLLEVVTI